MNCRKLAKRPVPKAIEEIRTAPVLHNRVAAVEQMPEVVRNILGI